VLIALRLFFVGSSFGLLLHPLTYLSLGRVHRSYGGGTRKKKKKNKGERANLAHFSDSYSTIGKISVSTMLACGVVAGCVGGGFGNPADVVNIRMVNDGKLPKEQQRHYKHAFDGLYRIVKDEGASQLMRGLGPNMNRAILMTSSQLVSYDGFKRQLLQMPWFEDNLITHFASSLLAVSRSDRLFLSMVLCVH